MYGLLIKQHHFQELGYRLYLYVYIDNLSLYAIIAREELYGTIVTIKTYIGLLNVAGALMYYTIKNNSYLTNLK